MPDLVSRFAAKAAGTGRYFTGKPCSKGHISERRVSSGSCLECVAIAGRRWRADNPDAALAATRAWRAANPGAVVASRAASYEKRADYYATKSAAYGAANAIELAEYRRARHAANRGRFNSISKAWRRENPDRRKFHKAMGRRRVRLATPPWLTKDHRSQMAAIYREARRLTVETGILHHVDHYYPLVSDLVCGLHVPWNLQVIPASANCAKKNSFPGHDPGALRRVA